MKRYLLFLLIFLPLCTTSFAVGQICIEGDGTGITKDEALNAAKINATRIAIKKFLTSQIEVDSFSAKENPFISKVIGDIKNLEIVSESKISHSLFQIKIRVTFLKNSIQKELLSSQILIESMQKPRILILISEENCGIWESQNQSAENSIFYFLSDPYHFDLISPAISASIKGSKQRIVQLYSDLSAAVATGTQNGAEVLIIGTAISKKAEINSRNPSGMVSVNADVILKAINCTTGQLICSANSHAVAADISHITAGKTAIENASISAIKDILDPVIKNWQGQLNIGISIDMTIKEVRSYRQKNIILQTLNRISNISIFREQIWNPESCILQLAIYYRGNPKDLYKKLDGYKLISGGGSLLVTGINGQSITLAAQTM